MDSKSIAEAMEQVEEKSPEPTHNKPLADKRRAGFTTNKGRGQSKSRRKIAAMSRKRNRKK